MLVSYRVHVQSLPTILLAAVEDIAEFSIALYIQILWKFDVCCLRHAGSQTSSECHLP